MVQKHVFYSQHHTASLLLVLRMGNSSSTFHPPDPPQGFFSFASSQIPQFPPWGGLDPPELLCWKSKTPISMVSLLVEEFSRRKFGSWVGGMGICILMPVQRNYPQDWPFPSGISRALPGQWETIWNYVPCRPIQENIAGSEMPCSNQSPGALYLHLTLLIRISCCYSISWAVHLSFSL